MTREEVKELLPIMQAFAEGKQIQDKIEYLTGWVDTNEINLEFEGKKIQHRIKPELKYRPFNTKEECWNEMLKHQPFGWIKSIKTENLFNILNLYESEGIQKIFINYFAYTFNLALNEFTFVDGTPFGIKEE